MSLVKCVLSKENSNLYVSKNKHVYNTYKCISLFKGDSCDNFKGKCKYWTLKKISCTKNVFTCK